MYGKEVIDALFRSPNRRMFEFLFFLSRPLIWNLLIKIIYLLLKFLPLFYWKSGNPPRENHEFFQNLVNDGIEETKLRVGQQWELPQQMLKFCITILLVIFASQWKKYQLYKEKL